MFKKVTAYFLILALFLSSCTHNVQKVTALNNTAAEIKASCSKEVYQIQSQLVACEKNKVIEYASQSDPSKVIPLENFYTQWEELARKHDNKQLSEAKYNAASNQLRINLANEFQSQAVMQDQQSSQQAAGLAILTLVAVAVVAAASAGGGGGSGGSNSYTPVDDGSDYRGCCSWHGGICGFQYGHPQCCDGQMSPTC